MYFLTKFLHFASGSSWLIHHHVKIVPVSSMYTCIPVAEFSQIKA